MQTEQVIELISLPKDFDAIACYKAGIENFTEVNHFEPNLQKAIEAETTNFKPGKSYEFKLEKVLSNGLFRDFIKCITVEGWFVGGATGLMLFWDEVRFSETEYRSEFCLSPTPDLSHMPYIYKGNNSFLIFGSQKEFLVKDEEKDFYNGQFILLFREK